MEERTAVEDAYAGLKNRCYKLIITQGIPRRDTFVFLLERNTFLHPYNLTEDRVSTINADTLFLAALSRISPRDLTADEAQVLAYCLGEDKNPPKPSQLEASAQTQP